MDAGRGLRVTPPGFASAMDGWMDPDPDATDSGLIRDVVLHFRFVIRRL